MPAQANTTSAIRSPLLRGRAALRVRIGISISSPRLGDGPKTARYAFIRSGTRLFRSRSRPRRTHKRNMVVPRHTIITAQLIAFPVVLEVVYRRFDNAARKNGVKSS